MCFLNVIKNNNNNNNNICSTNFDLKITYPSIYLGALSQEEKGKKM